ncbi:MAG: caspase family protein [Bacteroidota bacterium]
MFRNGLSLLVALLICALPSSAQEKFSKTFGGDRDEHAMAVTTTATGDYVVAGFTNSYGLGKSDVWVMKLDDFGNEVWRQYFGDKDYDWANDLIETRDGNYVLAGYTRDQKSGKNNAWVFQLNRHGELMWSRTYGGKDADEARSIIQTKDGGFAVAGFSYSNSKGKSDIWLLRLNAVGEILWDQHYGGSGIEKAYSIAETSDEGFVIGGYQHYNETNRADMLVVRTDRNGRGIWRRVVRAPGNDVIESVLQTDEGQFLAAGWRYNESNKSLDACLVHLNASGRVLNEYLMGGSGKDAFYDLIHTRDGGYVLAGQSTSFSKSSDLWMVKLDKRLQQVWQKRSLGKGNDYGRAVAQVADGGFLLTGGTRSYSKGGSDMWVLKTDARGNFANHPDAAGQTLANQDAIVVEKPRNELDNLLKPNLYILSVGVSKYEDESSNLTYAHTDAASLASKFATQEGQLYGKVEIKQYLNEEATLTNIKTGINWLERQATQKDMVLVFISAHGALDNKGNLYILPTDYQAHNLFATAMNMRDLYEGMNGTPCKKLIFLDACHSGQSGYDLLEFASIKAVNLNKVVTELTEAEPGVTVMTSSSGKEFSYENPIWGHGAFTKAILEGLDGEADFNHDEVISLLELNLYVTERVKSLTDGRQHPYTPINLFGNIPLFVLRDR